MHQQNEAPKDLKECPRQLKQKLVKQSQLIRIEEVSSITTLAKSSINLWVAQGRFIPPITLSPTVKVWRLQDVCDWIDSQQGNQ